MTYMTKGWYKLRVPIMNKNRRPIIDLKDTEEDKQHRVQQFALGFGLEGKSPQKSPLHQWKCPFTGRKLQLGSVHYVFAST